MRILKFGHLALIFSVLSCSQYGLKATREEQLRPFPAQITVNVSRGPLVEKLIADIKSKGMFLRSYEEGKHIVIEQNWIRGESLRYYYLDFDQRHRHIAESKSIWRVRSAGHSRTTIYVDTAELLYCGEKDELKGRPDPKSGLWYETDPDRVRSTQLLKTFMTKNYPGHPLPRHISEFVLPNPFLIPPKSVTDQNKHPSIKRPGTTMRGGAG
ncbi:hypothetical protein GW915_12825 [bacterium]|nr:hypothetical protein [bacterium]